MGKTMYYYRESESASVVSVCGRKEGICFHACALREPPHRPVGLQEERTGAVPVACELKTLNDHFSCDIGERRVHFYESASRRLSRARVKRATAR